MAVNDYIEIVKGKMSQALNEQSDMIESVISLLEQSMTNGGVLHVFGAGHAGIIAEELFYRAGGLIPINPIFADGLMLNVRPITKTTALERLHGYAEIVLQNVTFRPNDVLLVHSVSGRNALPIEMAMLASSINVPVVALTSVAYSSVQPSRHMSGKRLYEVADFVIDNLSDVGDAVIGLPDSDLKLGPTSTVVGCALLHSILAEVAVRLAATGKPVPVFVSANLEGGETANRRWLEQYREKLGYM